MNPEDLLQEGSEEEKKQRSPLESLEVDLKYFSDSLKEVAIEIMVEGLSKYPIFIAHQHEVKLGEVIFDRHEMNTDWTIQASTLEEFMERGVIKKELRQRFIDTYKNPDKFICVFVIVPEGANFVFSLIPVDFNSNYKNTPLTPLERGNLTQTVLNDRKG